MDRLQNFLKITEIAQLPSADYILSKKGENVNSWIVLQTNVKRSKLNLKSCPGVTIRQGSPSIISK